MGNSRSIVTSLEECKNFGLSNCMSDLKDGKSCTKIVEKGWGHELHIVNCPDYCMKKLVFNKEGAKLSMHFHKNKNETWFIQSGKILVNYINTDNASRKSLELNEGDVWTNTACLPHQIVCLSNGAEVIEVSTFDASGDNYRVEPGDNQNANK